MTTEGLLILYGGTLILPLAVIEGPIVSVMTGVLSASGHIDWYNALFLLVCADLIGDLICYAIGRTGGSKLGTGFAPSPELRRELTNNATKMLLIGKWTHAIGCVVLIGGGALRVPLSRFVLVNLIATIPKSAVLFGLGYFAAEYLPVFQDHTVSGTILLCVLAAVAIMLTVRRARTIGTGS